MNLKKKPKQNLTEIVQNARYSGFASRVLSCILKEADERRFVRWWFWLINQAVKLDKEEWQMRFGDNPALKRKQEKRALSSSPFRSPVRWDCQGLLNEGIQESNTPTSLDLFRQGLVSVEINQLIALAVAGVSWGLETQSVTGGGQAGSTQNQGAYSTTSQARPPLWSRRIR